MAKRYKYKLYKECDTTDKDRRQDIRKQLNSSERQRGKLEAVSGKKEYEISHDNEFIDALRWNMEMELADECWRKELTCVSVGLATLLMKLDVGKFNLHKCTCSRPEKLSNEEILKRYGY